MPINIPGTDAIFDIGNISPYLKAATTIGRIFGFDPVGDLASKVFGGSEKRGVPVGAIAIDNTRKSSFLDRMGLTNFQEERDFRRYRYVNAPLNSDKETIQLAANGVITMFRSLGFNQEADALQAEIQRADRVPDNPQGFAAQVDELLEITNVAALGVEDIINKMNSSPEFQANFEAQTGMSFLDQFIPEFDRMQVASIAQVEVLNAQRELDYQRNGPAAQNVRNSMTSLSFGGGIGELFFDDVSGSYQRIITPEEETAAFEAAFAPFAEQVRLAQEAANYTPQFDISSATSYLSGAGAGMGLGFGPGQPSGLPGQQPTPGQQPGQPADPGDPTQKRRFPNIPISQLLKLLPQNKQQQQPLDFGLPQFNMPQFDFGQFGQNLGQNFGVESALGGGNPLARLAGLGNQQTLEPASGLPFSPTSGKLFASKQKAPKGLAFLS